MSCSTGPSEVEDLSEITNQILDSDTMSQVLTQKSPRSRRKQTQVKKVAASDSHCAIPQLPIEVWALVSRYSYSFQDALSLTTTCKYIYSQLDPWQRKAAKLILELTNTRNESFRRALRLSAASGEPFSGFLDLNFTLLDQFCCWRDEYWMCTPKFIILGLTDWISDPYGVSIVSACKSPRGHVHRFEGWEKPERISGGTSVAAFLDWLLAIDRTLCIEDMKIVQRVFQLAPTLIGTDELTAATAQKFLFEIRFGSAQDSKGLLRLSERLYAVLLSVKNELRLLDKPAMKPILIICDVLLSKNEKTMAISEQIVDVVNSVLNLPPPAPMLALKPTEALLNYSSIHNWRPKDVAKAMTVLEAELFMRVQPHEIYGGHWMRRKRSSPLLSRNVKYMINRFNAFSSWVASSILSCSHVSKRADRLSFFIKTCKHLIKMRNFNGALELCAGFNTAVVTRLKLTRSHMSSSMCAEEQAITNLLSADLNFGQIRGIIGDSIRQREPYIPYLGLVLNDALSVIDTDVIDPGPEHQTGLWFCLNKVASLQTHGVEPLKTGQDALPGLIADLKPKLDPVLLDYLQYLPGYPDDELFAASLVLEPRRTGVSTAKLQVVSPIPDGYSNPAPKFTIN